MLIGAGVHSNEIGSAQTVNELVWRLATGAIAGDRPPAAQRDRAAGALAESRWPADDGRVAGPQRRHASRGRAAARALSPLRRTRQQPRRLHADAGRDAAPVAALYRDWLPEVYLDLHQMGTGARPHLRAAVSNPANPNVDPLVWSEANLLGQTMADAPAGGGQDRRDLGRDLQRLLAGRQQHDARGGTT